MFGRTDHGSHLGLEFSLLKGFNDEFNFFNRYRGAWVTQSVQHATLHLGVMSSNPTLGVEITLKNFF